MVKLGRRISARVGDLFNRSNRAKTESTTLRVDEHPPKIDEPPAIAPLENPTDGAKVVEAAKAAEIQAPVVAATA